MDMTLNLRIKPQLTLTTELLLSDKGLCLPVPQMNGQYSMQGGMREARRVLKLGRLGGMAVHVNSTELQRIGFKWTQY